MRFLLLVLGFALGVASTLAYAMFADSPEDVPPERPLPSDPPITLMLGERFLDGMIRRAALATPGVAEASPDIRVQLRDDTIVVQASLQVLGRPATGSAVLRPALRDGKLRFDVVETDLGGMPFPPIEQMVENQINARVQPLLAGMPITVTGATLDRNRGLVVTARVDFDRPAHLPSRSLRSPRGSLDRVSGGASQPARPSAPTAAPQASR